MGLHYDPKDPQNFGPEGMFGPKGPFGPYGPFGPNGPGHFPPEGSGGIGQKGRWGSKEIPKEVDGGPFGDGYPYGKDSKYPAAWGMIQISPVQGILDGVPDDVDVEWPRDWKSMYRT